MTSMLSTKEPPQTIANPVARETQVTLPASATRSWIVWLGFAAWIAAIWLVRKNKVSDLVLATMICTGATVGVNYLLDAVFLKIYKSPAGGLDWSSTHPSLYRTVIKFVGLIASLGFITFLYWIFPEYNRDIFGIHRDHPVFYGDYKQMLLRYLPWGLALAIPYIYFVDARQKDPHDGYYSAGMAATLQFDKVNWQLLWQHCLSWLVKGFFLALMFTYAVRDMRNFINYDFSLFRDLRTFSGFFQNFHVFFDFTFDFLLFADVGLVVGGYLFSLKLFDTQVRRTEPTVKGWVVALICYQPFWSGASSTYLDYSTDYMWGRWLYKWQAIYVAWGFAILILYALYLWATITFGARFSNLTHRGILTNGPYRFTKHPAYISKNTAYWLTFIPFVVSESIGDSIRRCVLLAGLNYVYYLRAKTEEVNLSVDPVYVQYAEWIRQHGIFRWLPRWKKS